MLLPETIKNRSIRRRVMRLIFVALLCLFLASCMNNANNPALGNYNTGSQGVEISFVQGSPPALLYEGDPLNVVLQLRNLGAFPETGAPQGKIILSGFDNNAINGQFEGGNANFPTELSGRSEINPQGGYALKEYTDNEVRIPFDSDRYQTTLMATSCYKYRTKATPTVCVDPDPNGRVGTKACTVRSVAAGTQGAPIAVTSVDTRISSNEVFFTARISNVGGGTLITPAAFSSCPFALDYKDKDVAFVTMRTSFSQIGECTPRGTPDDPVRMLGGTGTITCAFNNPGGNAFTTPVEIIVDYAYSKSITHNLVIENPNARYRR
jgi:hypothetical protein